MQAPLLLVTPSSAWGLPGSGPSQSCSLPAAAASGGIEAVPVAMVVAAAAACSAQTLWQLLEHRRLLAHAMAELLHAEAAQTAAASPEQSGPAQLRGQGLLLSHDHEQPCAWGLELL